MKEISIYYFTFLIVFTMHEFEEVLFLIKWLNRKSKVSDNKLIKRLKDKAFKNMNETKFGLIVLEEYILLLVGLIYVVLTENFMVFVGIVGGYIVHLVGHIIQAILIKTYIPGLGTGILSGVVSTCIVVKIINLYSYSLLDVVKVTAAVFIFIILNLLVCHFIAAKFGEKNLEQ